MTEEERIEQLPEPVRTTAKLIMRFKPDDLPTNPQKDTWYTYRPDGCICSDGTPYYSTLKIGKTNKLLILFCGGGVAVDAYSAARPNTYIPVEGKPTFYIANTFVMGYFTTHSGIANKDKAENPFKDWSVLCISYGNADFHCGTNSFEYEDEELGKGVCHHFGYKNYRAMIEKMKQLVPNPEQVMVTGYSAGGWATALLTDDVMSVYDKCNNFVCLPDSSLGEYDWHKVATEQWKTPKEICDRMVSNNMTVDCMIDLHKKHGDRVKIAFGCTYRDALLAQEQGYLDTGEFIFTKEGGDRFEAILKKSVQILMKEIPNISLYIYDRPNPELPDSTLTDHTFVAADYIYDYSYSGVKPIDWLADVANGQQARVGLELLEIR